MLNNFCGYFECLCRMSLTCWRLFLKFVSSQTRWGWRCWWWPSWWRWGWGWWQKPRWAAVHPKPHAEFHSQTCTESNLEVVSDFNYSNGMNTARVFVPKLNIWYNIFPNGWNGVQLGVKERIQYTSKYLFGDKFFCKKKSFIHCTWIHIFSSGCSRLSNVINFIIIILIWGLPPRPLDWISRITLSI